MKPKILHIYKDFWPPIIGGAEKTIHLMCLVAKDQFDPSVLVSNRCGRDEESMEDGIRVFKAATYGRYFSAPLTPFLFKRIKEIEADLLHVHLPNPTAEISILLARPKIPVVVTWHSDVVRQAWAMSVFGPFHRAFLNRVQVIMPTSAPYMASSRELEPFRNKCEVVPLAICVSEYQLSTADAMMVEQLRRKKLRPAVVFIGRLRYYKGLHFLLEAFRNLDADAWIIGSGPEGEALRKLSSDWGLGDRVFFLGDLTDEEVKIRLHAADIYCLPSHLRAEAFGLNQLEAMACGLPVVSADVGGVAFVNKDGESGIVVRPGDAVELKSAIQRLIDDESLRKKMAAGARNRVRNHFDLPQLKANLTKIYQKVLAKCGH